MIEINKNMNGKICMVTGATSGIGKLIAQGLALRGATLIIVGRNAEKSAATANEIKQKTGNQSVETMLADLSSQKDIYNLVFQFKNKYKHLHVLVNDAAGLFMKRQSSIDEIEMTFALNHLAYFLLTNLLLDILKGSAPARIINVSARLHRGADINFNDIQYKNKYSGLRAYKASKLANILFTYELAQRLKGTNVTVNAVQPETIAFVRLFKRLTHINLPFISPEYGAETAIYLATSPKVEDISGKYFVKQEAIPSSIASYDKTSALRLWQISKELTGLQNK
ncbi:MAG: SDR family NAD(P)-dependent oxidoreductase [Actinobacteria bacterium]|nr:SDR family NAD(P)-dependent oxidoreductase [Actinomycetota bacterium]